MKLSRRAVLGAVAALSVAAPAMASSRRHSEHREELTPDEQSVLTFGGSAWTALLIPRDQSNRVMDALTKKGLVYLYAFSMTPQQTFRNPEMVDQWRLTDAGRAAQARYLRMPKNDAAWAVMESDRSGWLGHSQRTLLKVYGAVDGVGR